MNNSTRKKPRNFLDPLVVTPLPNAKYWRLEESFQWVGSSTKGKERIVVHHGFETDFASVSALLPVAIVAGLASWYFWGALAGVAVFCVGVFLYWYANGIGRFGAPPVLHDFLYWSKPVKKGAGRPYTRKECDQIFLAAMELVITDPRKRLSPGSKLVNRIIRTSKIKKLNALSKTAIDEKLKAYLLLKSKLFYWAVRLAGGLAWKSATVKRRKLKYKRFSRK